MMTASSQAHLYIKHAVGSRMLFDVSGDGKPFTLEEASAGWTFQIEDVDPATAALLEENAQDLNLFYFIQQPGEPIQKAWFYDKDRPRIEYDAGNRRCTLHVDSRMAYSNEKV
ncbi:hypothetical protein N0M98_04220 [Paenibacillus doosanensis]|uniref:hypothetical protein n=1 Tax=Paenibacillus doosanensis TaxID=1229154 RepID=UPI0021806AF8|nr:hypothetical protein [Paenibacillus doosanensis]MCS7459336.1 hypothetical protein [Paenibacillus doosanensis]